MIDVRLVLDFDNNTNVFQQTPNNDGIWGDIRFSLEEIEDCDYLLVYNRLSKSINVRCPENNKWLIAGEPPEKIFHDFRKSYAYFDKLIIQDILYKNDPRTVYSHGALPWHVKKNYAFLSDLQHGEKKENVSCIMSTSDFFEGHKKRIQFSQYLSKKIQNIDFFGKGTRYIDDKFDALYPYKYSVAIENYATPHYWTEKLADCFLGWTMPIYYGAPNIKEYFPEEAMIVIDLDKPEEACDKIISAFENKYWEKNIEALEHARNLILNKYQLFPYISNLIQDSKNSEIRQKFHLPHVPVSWELKKGKSIYRKVKSFLKKNT